MISINKSVTRGFESQKPFRGSLLLLHIRRMRSAGVVVLSSHEACPVARTAKLLAQNANFSRFHRIGILDKKISIQ